MMLAAAGAYLTLWASCALADTLRGVARRREVARLEAWWALEKVE